MENKLYASLSPHIQSNYSVRKIMFIVCAALLPAWIVSVVLYGMPAFLLTFIGIVTAVVTEFLIQKFRRVKVTALDGSAVLTGMLVAFNLPPAAPWWIPIIGSFFAIAVAKQAFGGLGFNIVNPALIARAFLLASFPVEMTAMGKFIAPKGGNLAGIMGTSLPDAITGATPLTVLKLQRANSIAGIDVETARSAIEALYANWMNCFLGNIGGVIGETSAIALIIGGLFLIAIKLVDYRIPLAYIGTVAVMGWFVGGAEGLFTGHIPFQLFSGGLMLGAFFMATDYVTSPITKKGRWIFGIGCGLLTVVIRRWGGYPEGVSYSILLMNIAAPLIDRFTQPKKFGGVK